MATSSKSEDVELVAINSGEGVNDVNKEDLVAVFGGKADGGQLRIEATPGIGVASLLRYP